MDDDLLTRPTWLDEVRRLSQPAESSTPGFPAEIPSAQKQQVVVELRLSNSSQVRPVRK
jgi:hypothetical protein